MSSKLPWFKFYAADYQEDIKLRRCTLAARGLWVEMLCIMDRYSSPYGFMRDESGPFTEEFVANKVMKPLAEIRKLRQELEDQGVFSRDENRVIYSRRMLRDGKKQTASIRHDDAHSPTSFPAFDAPNSASNPASTHAGGRALTSGSVSKYSKSRKTAEKELTDEQFVWFQEFWALYWRKVCRQAAESTFARIVHTGDEFQIVMAAIVAQTAEMNQRDADKIPHAATWLHNKRWNDEIAKPAMSRRATSFRTASPVAVENTVECAACLDTGRVLRPDLLENPDWHTLPEDEAYIVCPNCAGARKWNAA